MGEGKSAQPSRKSPWRILIIDDNNYDRLLCKDLLQNMGYKIKSYFASNGGEGVRIFSQTLPDIVFLDLIMPKEDGFHFLKNFRKQLKFTSIPIIIITADPDMEEIQKAIELGASDFIIKPIRVHELENKMEKFLPIMKTNRDKIFCSIYTQSNILIVKINGYCQLKNIRQIKAEILNKIKAMDQEKIYLLMDFNFVDENSIDNMVLDELFAFYPEVEQQKPLDMVVVSKNKETAATIKEHPLTHEVPLFPNFEKGLSHLNLLQDELD